MSDPASAASQADTAATAASAAAASAAADAATAASTAAAATAADTSAATAASTAAAATAADTKAAADNAQALTDAREYLKGVVADAKELEGKSDAEVLALAKGAKTLAEKIGTAPEKYEAFKAPDGVTVDPAVVTEFEGVAKELGLSQSKAQTLFEKMSPAIAKQQSAHITATLAKADTEWQAASKADPEFGGDKFDENMAHAKRTLDTFGTPELTKLLNDSRMGNHPEWVRLAVRVGKALSPDGKHVTGGTPGQGEKSLADRLYAPKT